MILGVDIGNTTIHFGVIQKQRIGWQLRIATQQKRGALRRDLQSSVQKITQRFPELREVVICSVVPQALGELETILRGRRQLKVSVVGKDIKVPLINRYAKPRQVGQDRLVGAFAAQHDYGCPVIVVDLGTAITIDVVSRRQEYLGGIIVPGLQLSTDTLFQKAALLPKVAIKKPKALIGKDTEGSILSGIFFGYGEMIKGMVKLMKQEVPGKAKVVITGGHTDLMKFYLAKSYDQIDPDLVLKGLGLLASQVMVRPR